MFISTTPKKPFKLSAARVIYLSNKTPEYYWVRRRIRDYSRDTIENEMEIRIRGLTKLSDKKQFVSVIRLKAL